MADIPAAELIEPPINAVALEPLFTSAGYLRERIAGS
jgi:hypothetical protein